MHRSSSKPVFCPRGILPGDCISADFNMGCGIVTEFNKRFNLNIDPCSFIPWLYAEIS